MCRTLALMSLIFACTVVSSGMVFPVVAPAFAITVDGTQDAVGYELAPSSLQAIQTNFGNASSGSVDFTNGSELDVAFGTIEGTTLYLFLGGNLESNLNDLEIFFDCIGGGQNRLLTTNPFYQELNRMGDDGSGNGLRFDTGFEPDYWIGLEGGDGGNGSYTLFARYAALPTGGGTVGYYLGQTGAASNGTLSGGFNPNNILAAINNRNVVGVGTGCSSSNGFGVPTGVELGIPMAALGNTLGCVQVCVFVNGRFSDFVSNQVLGPLSGFVCNLGEPRTVNFASQPGEQFFSVCGAPTSARPSTWGRIKVSYH